MSDAKALPAGMEQAPLLKRAAEQRIFKIDCSEALQKHELIVSVTSAEAAPGLTAQAARTRDGTSIEVLLGGGPVGSSQPHRDYPLNLTARTSQGVLNLTIVVRSVKT